jgi:hypothetical protein
MAKARMVGWEMSADEEEEEERKEEIGKGDDDDKYASFAKLEKEVASITISATIMTSSTPSTTTIHRNRRPKPTA